MSYEYDPRELGRKGGDQQASSGQISEEECQHILFDFSPGESAEKQTNQDEELDIWKMIPGIASNIILKKSLAKRLILNTKYSSFRQHTVF